MNLLGKDFIVNWNPDITLILVCAILMSISLDSVLGAFTLAR